MTQAQFGRELGLTEARIQQIEAAGTGGVFLKVFRALQKLTGDPIEKLLLDLSADSVKQLDSDSVDPDSLAPVPDIPMFDLAVAAGGWTEVVEVGELRDERQIRDGRFRIRIRGQSMEPVHPNGCLIEFQSVKWGIDELLIGRDYYVQRDSEATFKRLESIDGETLVFRAINVKKFPRAMPVEKSDVVRMALAVGRMELFG